MSEKRSLIDISVPLGQSLPVWPGSSGFLRRGRTTESSGAMVTVSEIEMEVHTGTHVDAPRHFLPDGGVMESLSLTAMCGLAQVVEIPAGECVTREMLEQAGVDAELARLLLKTKNSALWQRSSFQRDYQALTPAAAEWVVANGIGLIGIDYLSIQRYADGPEVHQILLGAGVVVLEGITLMDVDPGHYELICAPLAIPDAEAAPARAFLRTHHPHQHQ